MRLPDKRRFINAVNHIEQAEIPLFELEADMAIVRQMMGQDYDMALHSFELPIADVVEWNRRMGNDMVYFGHVWHLGRKEQTDADGRVHYVDGMMKERSSLEDITYPEMDVLRRRLDELFAALDGTGFGVCHGAQTAGFTVPTAIGYGDFCMQTITDPEFILDFQKRVHDYCMREMEMILEYPVDVIKIASGLITTTGSMISPEMMDQFEFPYIADLANLIKSRDRLVLFHVDGDVTPHIPRFLEMGADILNPIDPSSGAEKIYEIKAAYGDLLALCGNIDIDGVLLKGTPEDVRADVHEHIERLAAGGGYIVASSHDLHQLLPVENVYAMRDAVHSFRLETG
ncbi:MAG: uroporphyrinogen decarboxylase family protein [Kiritimatiellia bacterium]|jgi:hypothetical protein|nr:uroporphyrinogen decarboxylase family protein [Kiritimatiellia bacterium]